MAIKFFFVFIGLIKTIKLGINAFLFQKCVIIPAPNFVWAMVISFKGFFIQMVR